MRLDQFSYDLPEALIAQQPAESRTASRLMVVDRATGVAREHTTFDHLPDHLVPGDVLVVNRSRVVPARLLLRRDDGVAFEVLVVRADGDRRVFAWARPLRKLVAGDVLRTEDGLAIRFLERAGEREARFELVAPEGIEVLQALERSGHVPLPPYIRRPDAAADRERYQTVFARDPGSVAAPTAGLHFDDGLLARLRKRGVTVCEVVLHVGPGTFAPLDHDVVEQNRLHPERFTIDAATRCALALAYQEGRRVIAVGTTVARTLEAAAARGGISDPAASGALAGETDLFIYPGYAFGAVSALVTNFHLPRSSLLLLVCAFLGAAQTPPCYRDAVARDYRFYSYGDAMIIL